MYEVEADDVAASLKFASAEVTKVARSRPAESKAAGLRPTIAIHGRAKALAATLMSLRSSFRLQAVSRDHPHDALGAVGIEMSSGGVTLSPTTTGRWDPMTAAAQDPYPHVIEASDSDLRESIRNAEQRSGYTYDQLAEQARTGNFASFKARLAWVAVGGLREIVGH